MGTKGAHISMALPMAALGTGTQLDSRGGTVGSTGGNHLRQSPVGAGGATPCPMLTSHGKAPVGSCRDVTLPDLPALPISVQGEKHSAGQAALGPQLCPSSFYMGCVFSGGFLHWAPM